MSYGLIYRIPFSTIDKVNCVVEVEKYGYNGDSVTLTGSTSPFVVTIEDEEFIYTPTRFSTATIKIVGSDYLQNLFSTSYQQYRVTFKRGGKIVWCGFIKPELYTQDYSSEIFTLELECMSGMSTLEFIDYKQEGEEGRVFISLWDILKKCISSANSQYTSIYIPYVYATNESSYEAGGNVLETMTISEQNFFDEDDKPMKLKEVLEEICKLMNWTCVDWRGELYFVDVDHTGVYYKYSPSFQKTGECAIPEINVQDIGFTGSEHTLDILPGYNKASVKTNNYNVGKIFPEEIFKNLKRMGVPNDYVKDNKVSHKIFLRPSVFKMFHYESGTEHRPIPEEKAYKYPTDKADSILGAYPIRRCNYEMKEKDGGWVPSITNYNYEDLIQLHVVNYGPGANLWYPEGYNLERGKPLLTYKAKLPSTAYGDGAIAIKGQMQISADIRGERMYSFGEQLPKSTVKDLATPILVCEMCVGGKYWNGNRFVDSPSTFDVAFEDDCKNGGFANIKSTKTLDMPYNGLDGYIIQMPIGKPLTGELKFSIVGFVCKNTYTKLYLNCFIKGLELIYKKMDGMREEEDDSDRIYENIVNENYTNELDEIEFKISSYNNDGTCYSKVILCDTYLTDNLYSVIEKKSIRPEELLIRRIVRRYNVPRFKLTQILKYVDGMCPITRTSDKHMVGKKFINAGGEIDYKMNRFECIMIEL